MLKAYSRYELLFTPHLIPPLKDLRGEEWRQLIDRVSQLPETHPEVLAFTVMMIRLNSCLGCEMDCYRAQKGCALCARHTVASLKETDGYLLRLFEKTRNEVNQKLKNTTTTPIIRLQTA